MEKVRKKTQMRHLDYLSEDNAIFSIFDERISVEEKEKLRIKLVGHNKDQIKKLLTIDPNFNTSDFEAVEDLTDINIQQEEDTEHLVNIIHSTEKSLYEKNFVDVESEQISNIQKSIHKSFFSKSPFDFVTFESLKCLIRFGIDISFIKHNAIDWTTKESFLNAIKLVNNIRSTSIYTEQLVGRISRLNDSCLLTNKQNLNSLAQSAIGYKEL